MAKKDFGKGEVVIYQTPQKEVKLDVHLEKDILIKITTNLLSD